MTTDFRAAILATIAYHDVFGLPLTRFEVGRYLIRQQRRSGFLDRHSERSEESQGRDPSVAHLSFAAQNLGGLPQDDRLGAEADRDIGYALEQLGCGQQLSCINGFWCLPGREHLVAERIEKHKLTETKWKILQRWGNLLAYVPFVRAVFVSGSLVFHNVHHGSDLDILIITRYGRIWTTRALATGLVGLFGRRRHGAHVKDRICFNHFLTDQSLRMPYPSLYNAVTYSRLTALFELGVTHAQFLGANNWIGEYLAQMPRVGLASWKTLRQPFGSAVVQRAGEWLLVGWFGNQLERLLKLVQRRRIAADPRSVEPGGRVVATDDELEFHPASPESAAIAAYHERLRQLGMPHLVRPGDSSLEAVASG